MDPTGIDLEKIIVSVTPILPGLWLGNEAASQDDAFLRRHNIRIVINATKHLPFRVSGWRVPVNDPGPPATAAPDASEDYRTMREYLPATLDLIREAKAAGLSILVHCHAGIQRSAFIVLCHLVDTGLTLAQALSILLDKRPQVFGGGTSINFLPAIKLKFIEPH